MRVSRWLLEWWKWSNIVFFVWYNCQTIWVHVLHWFYSAKPTTILLCRRFACLKWIFHWFYMFFLKTFILTLAFTFWILAIYIDWYLFFQTFVLFTRFYKENISPKVLCFTILYSFRRANICKSFKFNFYTVLGLTWLIQKLCQFHEDDVF